MSVSAGTGGGGGPGTYVYLGDCYINNATHNNQGVKCIPCITEIVLHGAEKPRGRGEREEKKPTTKGGSQTKRERRDEKKKRERKERREKNEKRKRLRGHSTRALTAAPLRPLSPGPCRAGVRGLTKAGLVQRRRGAWPPGRGHLEAARGVATEGVATWRRCRAWPPEGVPAGRGHLEVVQGVATRGAASRALGVATEGVATGGVASGPRLLFPPRL